MTEAQAGADIHLCGLQEGRYDGSGVYEGDGADGDGPEMADRPLRLQRRAPQPSTERGAVHDPVVHEGMRAQQQWTASSGTGPRPEGEGCTGARRVERGGHP